VTIDRYAMRCHLSVDTAAHCEVYWCTVYLLNSWPYRTVLVIDVSARTCVKPQEEFLGIT